MNCADCGKLVAWHFLSLHSVLCRECWQRQDWPERDAVTILPGNYWYTHSDLTLDNEETARPDLGRHDVEPDSS